MAASAGCRPAGARLIEGPADLPGAHFIDLVATMDRLRVQCPWDARQTHASLAPHLLEESYDAVEALESAARRYRDLVRAWERSRPASD